MVPEYKWNACCEQDVDTQLARDMKNVIHELALVRIITCASYDVFSHVVRTERTKQRTSE